MCDDRVFIEFTFFGQGTPVEMLNAAFLVKLFQVCLVQ